MSLFTIAFSLFILMDSLGNIPLYIAFLKEIPPKRQRWIIFREMLIALFVIMLFSFLGDSLLQFLGVTEATVQISGGIILFIIALKMIFPPPKDPHLDLPHDSEPFIVPLAIPLVAGPSVLAAVIIYGHQESTLVMISAIAIAWFFSLLILLLSPTIKNALTWRGIVACERLMGLILTLIAVQMFLSGVHHHQTLLKNKTANIPLLYQAPISIK